MNDPERWADGAPDAPDQIRALLEAARQEGPTLSQKAGLAAKLGLPGASLWSLLGSKATIAGATLVAATVGVTAAQWSSGSGAQSQPAPRGELQQARSAAQEHPSNETDGELAVGSRNEREAQTDRDAEPDGLADRSDAPTRAAGPKARNRPVAQRAADPSAGEAPSEASLIRQARDHVSSSPRRALALLNRHRQVFPHGVLAQEREVLAIEALRNAGNSAAAARRADSFKAAHPDSAHDLGD